MFHQTIRFGSLGCIASLVLLGGCAGMDIQGHEREISVDPGELQDYLSDKPAEVRRLYAGVLTQGHRNLVLNHMRAGLAAMESGANDVAERSFDIALENIEAIYANNPQAEQARSKFVKENIKDFKGEPYERAMAYYYRGLLYLQEGDYENARASFQGGMLQDTMAEQETYRQDYALLAFLEGWASMCLGDMSTAREHLAEAREYEEHMPDLTADRSLLLVAETGNAPVKVAEGEHRERLRFARGRGFSETGVAFDYMGRIIFGVPVEDIFWQASTRGGREVDAILAGKALFKDDADATGDALVGAGLTTAYLGAGYRNDTAMVAGGAMALVGLFAKAVSSATTPQADIRYWDNLPDAVHLATAEAAAETESVRVSFFDAEGNELADLEKIVPVVHAGPCSIAWARSRSALSVPDRAPNSAVPAQDANREETDDEI